MSIQELLRSLIREVITEVLQEMQIPAAQASKVQAEEHQPAAAYIERGAVTERYIVQLSKDHVDTLRVAKGVAVTPLAKEKARALKLTIERES